VVPRKLRVEYPGAMYHVMSREIVGRISTWTTWTGKISSRRLPSRVRKPIGRFMPFA